MTDLRWLDLSLKTPAENLALDEALLEEHEEGSLGPSLRFWESPTAFVVLGYANRLATETNPAACAARGIPILRRSSGGGTVVQGPGCLNYNLILPINDHETATITQTNDFVMNRHREVFAKLLNTDEVQVRGCTDIALGPLKFSGNAQRRKRRALMFHGAFLLNFDLSLIEALLPFPSRQPNYRANRAHTDFLTNLHLPAQLVKDAVREAWQVSAELPAWPRLRTQRLATERFASDDWNAKF